jgi:hypothetical protein
VQIEFWGVIDDQFGAEGSRHTPFKISTGLVKSPSRWTGFAAKGQTYARLISHAGVTPVTDYTFSATSRPHCKSFAAQQITHNQQFTVVQPNQAHVLTSR